MNTFHFSSDIKTLQQSYHSFIANVTETSVITRANIIQARLFGVPVDQLSQIYGLAETTIRSWVRKVDSQGWEGLLNKEKSGRPCTLSDWQIRFIDDALQSDPQLYGYYVWDGPTVHNFIFHRFGISYSVRECQRLLHALGYVLLRPQIFPALGEEDRQDRLDFLDLLHEIEDYELYEPIFEDEVHFYTQPTVMRVWAKKGSEPKVKIPPSKGKVGYFGFVYPKNGTLCMVEQETFNFETYIESLREFLRKVQKPLGQTFAIIQ